MRSDNIIRFRNEPLRNPKSVRKSVEKIIKRLVHDQKLPRHKRKPRRIQVYAFTYLFTPRYNVYRLDRLCTRKILYAHPYAYGALGVVRFFKSVLITLDKDTVYYVSDLILKNLGGCYEEQVSEIMTA